MMKKKKNNPILEMSVFFCLLCFTNLTYAQSSLDTLKQWFECYPSSKFSNKKVLVTCTETPQIKSYNICNSNILNNYSFIINDLKELSLEILGKTLLITDGKGFLKDTLILNDKKFFISKTFNFNNDSVIVISEFRTNKYPSFVVDYYFSSKYGLFGFKQLYSKPFFNVDYPFKQEVFGSVIN